MDKYNNNKYNKNNQKKIGCLRSVCLVFPFLLGLGLSLKSNLTIGTIDAIVSLIVMVNIIYFVIRLIKVRDSRNNSDYKMQSGEIKYGESQNYANQVKFNNNMRLEDSFRGDYSKNAGGKSDDANQSLCPLCGKMAVGGYCSDCGYKFK